MGTRKKSLRQWPASFIPFKEFDDEEWGLLKIALGKEVPEEMLIRLEEEMFWWLSVFRHAPGFQYGADERKKAVQAQNHAKKLLFGIQDLGMAGKMALDDLCERQNVTRTAFMLCLAELVNLSDYFERNLGQTIQPDLAQVGKLVAVFDEFGISTAISKPTYSESFNPSPFVIFVDKLWRLRPELKVYEPKTKDFYPAFSQWLVERRDQVRSMPEFGTGRSSS